MLLSLFDKVKETVKAAIDEPAAKQFEIDVRGSRIPVCILFERRFNNRVTVNKNGVIIRISNRAPKNEQREHIDKFLKWAKDKLDDKPQLLDSLPQRQYVNGEILKVGQHEFTVSILHHHLPKSSAKMFKNNIVLSVAKGLTKDAHENTCSYLVAKCLCKFFYPSVSARIHELNERFFKKEVKSIKMKYATSFWGHCSHTGNIVISVRLLFAPPRVVDYVIIHELAHLVHMDHSDKFWKVVEQAMPDYRNAEKHLRDNHLKYYL